MEPYDLRSSRRSVRELYPVLLDAHGNIIDGFHRLEADPNWRRETLEHIRTPTQLILARIIANTHRREVSREERAAQISELAARLLEDEGVPKEEIVRTIAELTTFSERYVRDLLPDEYKQRPGAGPKSRVELSSTHDTAVAGMPGSTPHRGQESATAPDDSRIDDGLVAKFLERYRYQYDVDDFLVDALHRLYGYTPAAARRRVMAFRGAGREGIAPAKAPERHRIRPEAPRTTRCPLCERAGADLLLLRMKTETGELPPAVTEWLTEALRR